MMTDHFEDNLGNEAREITNHLKEYLQDAAPAIDEDYRNLQRTALGEMIKLSAEVIRPVESQIESRYHTAKKTAQTKIEETRNEIESRFKTDSEEARRHNKDRLAEIDSKYEPKLNTLEVDMLAKRGRLAIQAKAHKKGAGKDCSYKVMLTETIADGNIKKCKEERHEIEAAVPTAKRGLDTILQRADTTLNLYRQHIPLGAENIEPDSVEMRDPLKTFQKKRELAVQYLDTLN